MSEVIEKVWHNYRDVKYTCCLRTMRYVDSVYSENELNSVDVYFGTTYNYNRGYDGNNEAHGIAIYDWEENYGHISFEVVDENGVIHSAENKPVLHNYRLSDVDAHWRINYQKGLISNTFRLEMNCDSNYNFRYRGCNFNVIPRRSISTNRARGSRVRRIWTGRTENA